jgi:hypothetical protein
MEEQWLTVPQIIERLASMGLKFDRNTVYRKIRKGEIPRKTIFNRHYVLEADFLVFVAKSSRMNRITDDSRKEWAQLPHKCQELRTQASELMQKNAKLQKLYKKYGKRKLVYHRALWTMAGVIDEENEDD